MAQTRMCLSTRLFDFHFFANLFDLSIKGLFVPKPTYCIKTCLHVCLLQKKMYADALKPVYFDISKNCMSHKSYSNTISFSNRRKEVIMRKQFCCFFMERKHICF